MIDLAYVRANLRKGLYALIPTVVAVAVFLGLFTGVQAVAVLGLLSALVTLGFALYHAHLQQAPLSRQVVYAVAAAAAAAGAAFGIISPGLIEVVLPAIMAILAIFLADSNTDDEVPEHDAV